MIFIECLQNDTNYRFIISDILERGWLSLAKSPCMNCPDRCYKCHSSCEKYKTYTDKIQELNKKRRADDFNDYYCEKYRRIEKRRK